jgi:hypothetical protein
VVQLRREELLHGLSPGAQDVTNVIKLGRRVDRKPRFQNVTAMAPTHGWKGRRGGEKG